MSVAQKLIIEAGTEAITKRMLELVCLIRGTRDIIEENPLDEKDQGRLKHFKIILSGTEHLLNGAIKDYNEFNDSYIVRVRDTDTAVDPSTD